MVGPLLVRLAVCSIGAFRVKSERKPLNDGTSPVLASKYLDKFEGLLQPDEVLLNAGVAIQVEVSEKLGRGRGDGILGVTNLRLLHVLDNPSVNLMGMTIERSCITSVTTHWILLPFNRNLRITSQGSGPEVVINFYCGKRYCAELMNLLK